MKELSCFTCFIDIGRSNWSSYERSTDRYVNDFISFYSRVKLNLTIFCSDDFKEYLLSKIDKNKFNSKLNFQIIDTSDLKYFSDENLKKIEGIQKSETMIDYRKRDPSNPPEYSNPYWVAMMLSKAHILKIAKDRGIIYDNNIAWIDFGIAHSCQDYLDRIENKTLCEPDTNKIIFFNRQNIELSGDPFFYAKLSDNVLVPGGFFIVPTNLIDTYYDRFNNVVEDMFFKHNIIDDDQTIMSVFANHNSDICSVISSVNYKNNPMEGDWFPIFDYLK